MGGISPPLFGDMSKAEIQKEIIATDKEIAETLEHLAKLFVDKAELQEALAEKE